GIANMYFIHMGMLIRNNPGVVEVLTKNSPDQNLSNLNAVGFFGNLLSVTLGNIIGGAIMVGVVYWLIIVLPEVLRKRKITPIKKV
ncbi:MAG: formate/nitrite transporter family protein, partial [Actinobacteria bacterium]|nr:formate/nitrite transporter family protein [Actinomycetota bacterium]